MPLQPGTKLGPYKILAPAGAGGMGEVYKAADTRLNRTVAIKVLPEHFSQDAEMKQRFEREAQTIAAMNHPHICTLYDVGQQDGAEFLVMEYLEGETLASRIARGPLPLDEALKVGIEIADALDKAHGQGVTHRDLKPGNVMLTTSGAKLLDFGLAKLKQHAPSSATPSPAPAGANETTPGTILGTMQYMAPEQLEGQEADARTDIFAFGALFYEMVSGKKAFEGKSKAHLIAAILSVDPEPLSKLQPASPPALDFLVKRCLEKDPEDRLQTAWDLLCQLRWIAEGGADTGIPAPLAARRQTKQARLALGVAAVIAVIVVIPALLNLATTKAPLETRFLVATADMPAPEAAAISPDGQTIAYSARDAATTFLFVRPIDNETPVKLPGTEGAANLFWSPDSRSIAFFAGGRLKKVQASGGPPVNICDTPDMRGGTWNTDDVILFASSKGLQRVKAVGGEPMPVAIARDAVPHNPYFLPDGQHFLYLSVPQGVGEPAGSKKAEGVPTAPADRPDANKEPSGAVIYAGSLNSSDATRLVSAQSNAVYAEPGYLLYHREGTLYAHPFNPKKLALTGEAIRIADKLPYSASGAAAFSASQTGILIYRSNPQPPAQAGPGTAPGSAVLNLPLVWIDRSGKKLDQLAGSAGWVGLDLSPNGRRVAVHRHDGDGGDVWIFEPGQTTPSKFTFDASQDNSAPVWTRDGTQVAFGSRRNGKWGIYIKLADNTRNEEPLAESDLPMVPMTWSSDGQTLVYWTSTPKSSGDAWGLPMKGERKPFPILNSPADERHPQVSPDGKWIAYSSNETGRSEIYVQPFPQGTKIQVSVNGGVFPRWGTGGKELYFMSLISAGNLMVSNIRVTGASIQRDDPKLLFQTGFFNSLHAAGQYHAYAVSSDSQRFLIPQIENPAGVFFAGRGAALGINAGVIFGGIMNDRHAATSPAASGWSHEGTRIAFGSRRNGKWGLYVKAADGTGPEELILESDLPKMPMSWSPDGKLLVYWVIDPKTRGDVWMVPVQGDHKPVALLQTPADESYAQVSPDGKWMAYQSDETGTNQIYIRPFPEGSGNKSQVSTDGGTWPRWRGDGKELFFYLPPNMIAADVRLTGSSVQPGVPHVLFATRNPNLAAHSTAYFRYAVTADGQRFLFAQPAGVFNATGGLAGTLAANADQNAGGAAIANAGSINVVLNWTRSLKRK